MTATPRVTREFDHHSAEFGQNPLAFYRQWHQECPVVHSEKYGGYYVLTRHEDVAQAAGDPEHFSNTHDVDGTGTGAGGIGIPSLPVRFGVVEMDPPQHRSYRAMITSWLAPARVDAAEPQIREIIVEYIEAARSKGRFDVVHDLGTPIPACVTLELLRIPLEKWEVYAHPICDLASYAQGDPEWPRVMQDVAAAEQDLMDLIGERRQRPAEDYITSLLRAEPEGTPLSDEEIFQAVWVVLTGGFDTTSGAIAHMMLYLSENPQVRDELIADRERIPGAVEEFLRYYSPATSTARTVMAPVTLGEHEFQAGDRVLLFWGAANHDPNQFDEPDDLDISRHPNRHLAFGYGQHRCLGARLAQLEARIFLDELLERMPGFVVLGDQAHKKPSVGAIHVYKDMPAAAEPAALA